MPKILVVEDDRNFSETLKNILQAEKYKVDQAFDGASALDYFLASPYDLLILDWQLPNLSGEELLQEIRKSNSRTLVLMLTARDKITDKATALDGGADDYLVKPPDPIELLARVRALLRRPSTTLLAPVLTFKNIQLDTNKREVRKAGEIIALKPREFALLEFLMRYPSRMFGSDELVQRVWPAQWEVNPTVVRVAVNRLRSQLDEPGHNSIIKNVYGVGYGLNSDE